MRIILFLKNEIYLVFLKAYNIIMLSNLNGENEELYKSNLNGENEELYKSNLNGENEELYKSNLNGENEELYKSNLNGENEELYKTILNGENEELYKTILEELVKELEIDINLEKKKLLLKTLNTFLADILLQAKKNAISKKRKIISKEDLREVLKNKKLPFRDILDG